MYTESPVQDIRAGGAQDLVATLTTMIEDVAKSIYGLEGRLNPILTPSLAEGEEKMTDGNPMPLVAPINDRMADLINRVNACREHLEVLTSRVEL